MSGSDAVRDAYMALWDFAEDLYEKLPVDDYEILCEKVEDLGRTLCGKVMPHIWVLDQCGYIGHAYCSIPGCRADPREHREEVEALFPNASRSIQFFRPEHQHRNECFSKSSGSVP